MLLHVFDAHTAACTAAVCVNPPAARNEVVACTVTTAPTSRTATGLTNHPGLARSNHPGLAPTNHPVRTRATNYP
jgi:hypothetical protein